MLNQNSARISMNKYSRMLSSPTKLEEETSDTLAKLLRRLLSDLSINNGRMERFMADWIANPRNGISRTDKNGSTWKGNMMAQMSDERITFRTLLRTLMLMQPKHIRFIVECEWGAWAKNVKTRTGVDVNIDEIIYDAQRSVEDSVREERAANIRRIEEELEQQRAADYIISRHEAEKNGQESFDFEIKEDSE